MNKINEIQNQINKLTTFEENIFEKYSIIEKWIYKKRNEKIIGKLKQKVASGEKIKVGFFAIWASQFSSSKIKEVNVRVVYFPYTKGTSSTILNQTLTKLREN